MNVPISVRNFVCGKEVEQMKIVITIEKEIYETLNAYTVRSSNGSRMYRSKNNYRYKDSIYNKDEYSVLGMVNGRIVIIECKNYRSAKQLFLAMQ